MKLSIVTALALSTISLVACGGDDSDGLSTGHEGVYSISSWTGTENGCDGAGAPLDPPSSTARLYIQSASILGTDLINVAPCDDEASCQESAERSTITFSLLGWTFDAGSDADGFTGSGGDIVSGDGTTCQGTASVATMTFSGSAVHIENRQTDVEWAQPAGGCTLDDLPSHAAGAACTRLIKVDAAFATDL